MGRTGIIIVFLAMILSACGASSSDDINTTTVENTGIDSNSDAIVLFGTYLGEDESIIVFGENGTVDYFHPSFNGFTGGGEWKIEDDRVEFRIKPFPGKEYALIEDDVDTLYIQADIQLFWTNEAFTKYSDSVVQPSVDECYALLGIEAEGNEAISSEETDDSDVLNDEQHDTILEEASVSEESTQGTLDDDNQNAVERPYELNNDFSELENFYFYITTTDFKKMEDIIDDASKCGLKTSVSSRESMDYIDEPTYSDTIKITDISDYTFSIKAEFFRSGKTIYPEGIYYTVGPIVGEGELNDYCVSFYKGGYKIANARSPYKDIYMDSAEEAIREYRKMVE